MISIISGTKVHLIVDLNIMAAALLEGETEDIMTCSVCLYEYNDTLFCHWKSTTFGCLLPWFLAVILSTPILLGCSTLCLASRVKIRMKWCLLYNRLIETDWSINYLYSSLLNCRFNIQRFKWRNFLVLLQTHEELS